MSKAIIKTDGDVIKAQNMISFVEDVEVNGETKENGVIFHSETLTLEKMGLGTMSLLDSIFDALGEEMGEGVAINTLGAVIAGFIDQNEKVNNKEFLQAIKETIEASDKEIEEVMKEVGVDYEQ